MEANQQIKPENIFITIFKANTVIKTVSGIIGAWAFIILMNYLDLSMGGGKNQLNLFIWLPIVALFVIGVELLWYWFYTRYYIGRTMITGNQRGLRQILYIIFPVALIGDILAIFFFQEERIRYLIALPILISAGFLFYWRLRNKIKEEGKEDTSPILNKMEIIVIIIAVLIVFGMFYYLYKLSKGL